MSVPLGPPVLIDLHADVVYAVEIGGREWPDGDGQWTIRRAREGGLAAQFFPLWVPPGEADQPAMLKRLWRALRGMLDAVPNELALVRTSAEIRERAAAGVLSALLGIEGAEGLGDDPAAIEPYAALGLRYLGITWNRSNAFGEAAAEPRAPPGLTGAGRDLVARCNADGVLVDLAHASAATFWDAHRISRAPLLVSHAGLRALHAHRRNIDDLQLLALARTGGVIGIIFHSGFLVELPGGETTAPLDVLFAHFEHARAIGAGAALGLGSDFDGHIRPVDGLATASDFGVLAEGFRDRGWSEEEIRGVLGENFLRLLDAADAAIAPDASPAATHEWPLVVACESDAPAKVLDRLTDRLILPGTTFDPGDTVLVEWPEPAEGTAAAMEIWGARGGRFDVRPRISDTAAGERPGRDATIGETGSVRVDGIDDARAAAILVTGGPARIDEIAVWARQTRPYQPLVRTSDARRRRTASRVWAGTSGVFESRHRARVAFSDRQAARQ